MKSFVPVFAAGIISLTALSGLWTVNIHHSENIPPEINFSLIHRNPVPHFLRKTTTRYDINLREEIKDPSSVLQIVQVLQDAVKGDIVVFHLAGYGGEVETTLDLISNIQHSKAFVIMSVEAPVYSGHAYLALNGSKLVMADATFLMLHESTAVNQDCDKKTKDYDPAGLDRGVSNKEHCDAFKTANVVIGRYMIETLPFITRAEKDSLESGHDVYLYSGDMYKRGVTNGQ